MGTRKSLTNLILLSLEKAIDGYVRFDDLIHHSYFYAWGSGWDKPLRKSDISQSLKRLRKRGLIDFISDQEFVYRLTDKGRDYSLWVKMKLEDEKWDGKWRLVIWDIPEKRKAVRDLLRMKLKQLGFVRWQKSVWACKKNCTEILRKYIKTVRIEDWVMVLESDNIGKEI